jgi:hypothetical protein
VNVKRREKKKEKKKDKRSHKIKEALGITDFTILKTQQKERKRKET